MIAYVSFSKRFGSVSAVESLSIAIGAGEVVALLGPNGSGKTTTIKAAAGLVRPTSGRVLVGSPGRPAGEADARRTCSFLPQRVAFPGALSGREVLEFYRRLRDQPAARVQAVMALTGLNGATARAVRTYSGGMTQRLGLAVAMLPDAPILLLDEPTAALDPDGLRAFYEVVEARRAHHQTVLFSSHHLGDVERLADRFIVMAGGRLVAGLTARQLTDRLSDRGVMKVVVDRQPPELLDRVRTIAPAAAWSADQLVVPAAAARRAAVLDMIRNAGVEIRGLSAEDGRLDELYRELVGGQA